MAGHIQTRHRHEEVGCFLDIQHLAGDDMIQGKSVEEEFCADLGSCARQSEARAIEANPSAIEASRCAS